MPPPVLWPSVQAELLSVEVAHGTLVAASTCMWPRTYCFQHSLVSFCCGASQVHQPVPMHLVCSHLLPHTVLGFGEHLWVVSLEFNTLCEDATVSLPVVWCGSGLGPSCVCVREWSCFSDLTASLSGRQKLFSSRYSWRREAQSQQEGTQPPQASVLATCYLFWEETMA